MTNQYDSLIVGGGHNGLVCAAYLAKSGQKVLVLEKASQIGGAATSHEFAEGFKVSSCAHILNMLQPKIIKDLNLTSFGLELDKKSLNTISLNENGHHLILGQSGVVGEGVSDEDKASYKSFIKRMEKHAKILAPQLMKTPPRLAKLGLNNTLKLAKMGWDIRFGLGKKAMEDFLRIAAMNIHDLLDEEFESEAIKGALAFDAVLGTAVEPRMPSTVLTYLYRLAGGLGNAPQVPKGGMGSVSNAIEKAALNFGVEIKTSSPVQSIIIEEGNAVGVELSDGKEIRANSIISNADPKTTFLNLVGARNLETGFANRILNLRSMGRAAKVHFKLDELPDFQGLKPADLSNRFVIAPSRKYIDNAFNHSKYGEYSDSPAIEMVIPTISDPTMAPSGKHVLSAVVQYAPFEIKGGWNSQKASFVEKVKEAISRFAPNFSNIVSGVECLTPQDIENQYGITGGHWHHVELAFDQLFMMRPTYGAAQYQSPIDGLFLCGAGSHPGGGVMGAAGHNAAQVVLRGVK